MIRKRYELLNIKIAKLLQYEKNKNEHGSLSALQLLLVIIIFCIVLTIIVNRLYQREDVKEITGAYYSNCKYKLRFIQECMKKYFLSMGEYPHTVEELVDFIAKVKPMIHAKCWGENGKPIIEESLNDRYRIFAVCKDGTKFWLSPESIKEEK